MPLRDGIERHWVGMGPGRGWYCARRHAGGIVITGPGYEKEIFEISRRISEEGHTVAIAEESLTLPAWLNLLNQLSQ